MQVVYFGKCRKHIGEHGSETGKERQPIKGYVIKPATFWVAGA